MSDFDTLAAEVLRSRLSGDTSTALNQSRLLVERFPLDPRSHFELGSTLDALGHDEDAIPCYRRSLELGISGGDLPRLYLQLGSSLRNRGRLDESLQVLNEGCQRFPHLPSLKVFRSFTLEDIGRPREAITDLLDIVLGHVRPPDMEYYSRALRHYAEERKKVSRQN